jgi:hypothetical protein
MTEICGDDEGLAGARCGDGVLDCGHERNIDVCAVDPAERVVRGAAVEVEAESWPMASECVIQVTRETQRQKLATEPASETASWLGESVLRSRFPRLLVLAKREALLLTSR